MKVPQLVPSGTSVRRGAVLALATAAMCTVAASPASSLRAAEQGASTTSAVYWMWDQATAIGTSRLVRTESGISAVFQGSGVPAGHALTLWFGVINNPDACATRPCTLADFSNPEAQGDFLWGGGIVTGGSGKDNFGGHLKAGDSSGSGYIEFGMPEKAIGLTNPLTAEVLLLVHSHGPAVPGKVLKAQLSSFTGGCRVFNGPDGFAAGPGDVPDAVGECSTMQISTHQ